MKLTLKIAHQLAQDFCQSLGFSSKEAGIIADNVLEAEISGKKSHGLGNLLWFQTTIETGGINNTPINRREDPLQIIKETPVSLFINGQNRSGYVVIKEALDMALIKVKQTYIIATGLSNTAPTTGFLGHFARLVAERDLIFICWNTSPGRVSPFGAVKKLWGTNPFTIGIPTDSFPIIVDMATSTITVGQLLRAKRDGQTLPQGSAIDSQGNPSTDPAVVWEEGALLPIGGHKGSALSIIGEIFAGALTASKVGFAVPGGWGTFFLILNPEMFRPINDFKIDIRDALNELKSAPKQPGTKEIYYPGEHSQTLRIKNLKKGSIDIPDDLYQQLTSKKP